MPAEKLIQQLETNHFTLMFQFYKNAKLAYYGLKKFHNLIWFTSCSGACSHCLGLSSAAKYATKSKAVNRVCRFDDTNIKTGLSGECVCMPLKQGLFMVAIRGQ